MFCPKFHCELNAVEGVWCNEKAFVRSRTNQNFATMKKLIIESKEHLKIINLNKKLICRFWRCIEGYAKGATYEEILQTYFCGKSKEKIESHRRISNKNVNNI